MPSFSNTDHPSIFHTSNNTYTAQPLPSTSNQRKCTSLALTQQNVYGGEYDEPLNHYTASRHPQNATFKTGQHSTTLHLSIVKDLKPANTYAQEPPQTGMSTHFGDLHSMWNNPKDPGVSQNFAVSSTFAIAPFPKENKPLTLPFLSHPTFPTQVKHWLRKHILGHKNLAIPLHLATHRPREQAHLTLNSIPHNFRQWDNTPLQELPPCQCANFLLQHPHSIHHSGHIATTLDTLSLPPHLQHYKHCNGLSTAFLTWERYKQQVTTTFFQWLKHHSMPVQNTDHITNQLHTFLQQQWHQHKQHLARHTYFHVPEVFQLKRIITDQFIIHHADHKTARPRIFCPHLYLKAASTTWGDPTLFTPLPDTPSEANTNLIHTIPTWLAQKYKWGINTHSTLPQGFVFLKQKKQWAKGRTIISYKNSTLARLLKAVAIALDTMVKQTWPSAPGNASTPELWKALHTYMHTTSPSIHLKMLNDDLIGFFNSVPHQKLQHSLHILIHQWRHKYNQDTICWHYSCTWLLPLHSHWLLSPQQAHSQPQSHSHRSHTRHCTPQLPIQRLPGPRTDMAANSGHWHRKSNITNSCQHTHHTSRSKLATSIPTTTPTPRSSTWAVHLPSLCGQSHDHSTTTHLQQPPLPNPCTPWLLSTTNPVRAGGRYTFLGFHPQPCKPLHHLQSPYIPLANTRRLLSRITPSHTQRPPQSGHHTPQVHLATKQCSLLLRNTLTMLHQKRPWWITLPAYFEETLPQQLSCGMTPDYELVLPHGQPAASNLALFDFSHTWASSRLE